MESFTHSEQENDWEKHTALQTVSCILIISVVNMQCVCSQPRAGSICARTDFMQMLNPRQAGDPHCLHAHSAIHTHARRKKDRAERKGGQLPGNVSRQAGKQASKQIMRKEGEKRAGLAGRAEDKGNVDMQAGRYTGRNASKHYWQPMLSKSFFSQEAIVQRFWLRSTRNEQ